MSYAYQSSGLYVGRIIGGLVFMVTWGLTAIMGGLWGMLLGWLPAAILAVFCIYAWPLVLGVVVIAAIGLVVILKNASAPQPAAAPYAGIATSVAQAPAQDAPAVQSSPVAQDASSAVPAAKADPASPEPVHAFQAATFDAGVAQVFQGVPLRNANASELNALAEVCPSGTVAFDQNDGAVCGSQGSTNAITDSGAVLVRVIETPAGDVGCDVVPTYKPDTGGFICGGRSWVVAPVPNAARHQDTRVAEALGTSAPVPAASASQ